MTVMKWIILTLVLASTPSHANPVDGLSLLYGNSGNDDVDFYRVALRQNWNRSFFQVGQWTLGGYFEFSGSNWDNGSDVINTSVAADRLQAIAVNPVFRLQRSPGSSGYAPFIEFGAGLTYISKTRLSTENPGGLRFGGHFQFEDKFAAGLRLGKQLEHELAFTAIHYSNADLYDFNDGVDFISLAYNYWF